MQNDFPQITKGKRLPIPHSRFLTFHKHYKNMADSNYKAYVHSLLPLLRSVRAIAT